jgi:anti-sigma factor RsiW
VTDFLDDEASVDVRKKIEEHLSQCAPCRKYLSVARKMDIDLKSLPAGEAPEHVWAMIREKIQTAPVPLQERLRTWWEDVVWGFRPTFVYGSAVAAILVILIVLVPMSSQWGSSQAKSEKEEIANLAYLDEDSGFISEAEQTGSGTVVEHWL